MLLEALDAPRWPAHGRGMDYDSFRAAWTNALWKSGLRRIDLHPTESVDMRTMDRTYETIIEPLGGQDAAPFYVMAKLRWMWDALSNTRGWLGDESTLKELIGREAAAEMPTAKCFLRVDLELSASAPYGHPLPMPSPAAWQRWARETVQRLIDFFPPHEQTRVRMALSTTLEGIVCQRLVPRADGRGRVCATEIAVRDARLADAIADPERTATIPDIIATGEYSGMRTFDQHLLTLVTSGAVEVQAAITAASNPHDFSVALRRSGWRPEGEPLLTVEAGAR